MSDGEMRNKPCFCGSGKKFKKCHLNKKPREIILQADMGKSVIINRLKLQNNEITLMNNNDELTPTYSKLIKTIYKDDNKGKKIIFQIPQLFKDLKIDLSFLNKIDNTYIIDTNTYNEKINGQYLSVSVAAIYDKKLKYIDVMTKTFNHTEKIMAEKIGIKNLIDLIESRNHITKSKKNILIITDHDLDKLDQYNSRELPLFEKPEKFYIPSYIKLGYASADKKNDSEINRILNECDKLASKTIKEILENNKTI
ncbi:MAG: SEC-C domain-containing protein [Patescibacteria group bacterium]|nr:SEC-C domain-containing protein [Patescibacteria group bacterium]